VAGRFRLAEAAAVAVAERMETAGAISQASRTAHAEDERRRVNRRPAMRPRALARARRNQLLALWVTWLGYMGWEGLGEEENATERAASASRLAAGQAICSRWNGMEWNGMGCHANASGSGRGSSERDVAAAVAVRSDLDGNQLARRWLAGLVSLETTGSLVALQIRSCRHGRGRPPRRRTGQHAALQCGVEPAGDAAEMLFFGVKLPRVTVRGLLLVVKKRGTTRAGRRSTGSLSFARDGTPLTHETREWLRV
jgi:hypothetical protein